MALGANPAQAQTAGTKFRVSSLGNDVLQIQGAYEGTYSIEDGRLNVNVTYGVMRMLDRPRFQARTASITAIRFGIAHHIRATANSRATFAVDAFSASWPLAVTLTAGHDVPLTPYQTSVPIPQGTPLTDHWIMAELALPVAAGQPQDALTAHPMMGVYLAGSAAPAAPVQKEPAPQPNRIPRPQDAPSVPQPQAPPANTENGVPFHFSSIGGRFGTQGDFSGVYRIEGNRIVFLVDRAAVAASPNVRRNPRSFTSGIQFTLAHYIDTATGAWDVATSSEEVPLEVKMAPGDRVELDPFVVSIPLVPGMVLRDHWVRIQISDSVLVNGQKNSTRCYVESSYKVFR